MRTIGAKLSDDFYEECLSVQRLLRMGSRSDYVKVALHLLNGSVFRAIEETRLTIAIRPEPKSGEPPTAGRTEASEPSMPGAVAKEGES